MSGQPRMSIAERIKEAIAIVKNGSVSEAYREEPNVTPETLFIDEWNEGDGFKVIREDHNLITDPFRTLMAAMFAGDPTYMADTVVASSGRKGVQYWAVGSGNPQEDALNPAAPNPSDTQLFTEKARVPVSVSFVDAFNVATPGNAFSRNVQVQATFDKGVALGNNTEFGLFGGNATSLANSGLLLDRVTHPNKYKSSNDIRRLTIIFSF